jgi:RNA polymerase sigma-70 factor (ECF subfamily)
MFDETGHWKSPPQAWNDPEAALEQRRFWEAFEKCLGGLPASASRVFFKREVLGEDTPAICRDENITSSNCWVILHRARIALRNCLERNWFGREAAHGR